MCYKVNGDDDEIKKVFLVFIELLEDKWLSSFYFRDYDMVRYVYYFFVGGMKNREKK